MRAGMIEPVDPMVAFSGASAVIYGVGRLQMLKKPGIETPLFLSKSAHRTLAVKK
jgi:3-polyprenyl-4-hydroxybenzoate decarboxylase